MLYVTVVMVWPNEGHSPGLAERANGLTNSTSSLDMSPSQEASANGCYNGMLDTNGNGLLETNESNNFSVCYTQHASIYSTTMYPSSGYLQCDLNRDHYVNMNDQQCVFGFVQSSSVPTIIIPTPGTDASPIPINGLTNTRTKIRVRSAAFVNNLSGSVEMRITINPTASGSTTAYTLPSKFFVISQYLVSGSQGYEVELPFDTLAFPNGTKVTVTVCPPSGSSSGCSAPAVYSVHHTFSIKQGDGQTYRDAPTFSVDVSDQPNYVRYIVFPAGTSGATPLVYTTANPGDGSYTQSLTGIPDDVYALKVVYQPRSDWGGTYYGDESARVITSTFTVSRSGTPSSTLNTNTSGGTSNANATTNTSTTNTNRPTSTNTNIVVSNTNKAAINTLVVVPPAPVIDLPQNNIAYFKLSTIAGAASGATTVGVHLSANGLANRNCEQQKVLLKDASVSVTNKRFYSSLPSELCPGSYQVVVTPYNGDTRGPEQSLSFLIVPSRLTFLPLTTTGTDGVVNVLLKIDGSLSSIRIAAVVGSTTIDLGTAVRVSGSTERYSLTFDAKQKFGPGTYTLFARGVGLDGMLRESVNTLTLEMKNDAPTNPTVTTPSGTTPASGSPLPTTVPSADTQVAGTIDSLTTPPPTTPPVEPTASPKADPRQSGTTTSEKLKVVQYANVQAPSAPETPAIKLSGVGPANTVITLFIFSDPIVVTTRTDANGNWTYTLDQNLGDGRHEAYVTITDDTGQVKEKSAPLSLFIKTARAVSPEEYFTPTQTARESDTFLIYYIAMAGLLVLLAIGLIIYFRVSHNTPKLQIR